MEGYYSLDVAEKIKERKNDKPKQPHPHQQKAFTALSNILPTPIKGYSGTLLVLPTGGGKTFTAVNWICRHILSAGIKVLWLAQTAYLLDQAAQEFDNEVHNANGRKQINMRLVSSNTFHANAGTISVTDDILICTTQTAISSFNAEPLDGQGNITQTPFRRFIESCKNSQLFVVVDEAHHTPAYGCRTLLWGEKIDSNDTNTQDSFRTVVKNLYILGLTATPTNMDKRISGWLNIIFDKGICYEAKKEELQMQSILAVPEYIERQTGMEFEVDDDLFDRLMHKHKDLPENIIEYLAKNQGRNSFIASDYVNNKNKYGKTIIFADRWFQCEQILKNLKEKNIKSEAVYSMIAKNSGSYEYGAGRSDNNEHNKKVMDDFRAGKYDVLVNVKMLTEGIDVPDVKTVMITRQTTSNILMTQMMGRALRGKKAGGGTNKDFANIVFFHDTWKRLINWVNPVGDTNFEKPTAPPRNPLEWVSIHLVKLAAGDIEFIGFENVPYLTFIPVGFFGCEYTVSISDNEEMASFAENVVVYDFNKNKYFKLIDFLKGQNLTIYADEKLTDKQFEKYSDQMIINFFDEEKDNFDGLLRDNITKIVRHMAQNNLTEPKFLAFDDRSRYDMDKIATDYIDTSFSQANNILKNMFADSAMYWQYLYKTFDNFKNAFNKSLEKILNPPDPKDDSSNRDFHPISNGTNEITPELRRQVFIRDNYTCLCCGKIQSRGSKFQADHIIPVSMSGKNDISNLQTLCSVCNKIKGVNQINYRAKTSPLSVPKTKINFHKSVYTDMPFNAISRIVNEFYHCDAMYELKKSDTKRGQFYNVWEIMLYAGNNPEWLENHSMELLKYIHNFLGQKQVEKILIKN
ncbi:MAG: DEAD/DEAH box helicase family protein [Oscillospiraceae bacterium]|nr:DEAD/DEAH box helicase family protein [Oscillospiraceae bacterium]